MDVLYRKSSFSQLECVEVARLPDGTVSLRDSKDTAKPGLVEDLRGVARPRPSSASAPPDPAATPVVTPAMSPPPDAAPSLARSIQHRYPLRDDVDALLQLPRDLTTAEANRLAKFISTLAWDDAPVNSAAAPTNAS